KVAREAEEQLLKGGEIQQPYQVGFVRKDKGEAIVSISTRLTTEDGSAVAFEHVARDDTEQVRMRSSLEFYLRQILTAQEEERTRIARELHDGTAQEMLVLCQQLDRLANDPKYGLTAEARASVASLRANAISTLTDLRRMAQDLRPNIFDALGLVAALEWLVDDLQKQCGIEANVDVIGEQRPLAPEKELLVFRIAQEALRNVRRHSKASRANLRLEFAAGEIRVSVEDNGEGFKIPDRLTEMAYQGKLGLIGVQERVKLLGGRVVVRSSPGHGTTVCAELPDAAALSSKMQLM
ncbi:MAG: sensor histidine kinase, partial [Dehalococcoidia bacterium]|nr:sensor histidine kinase [Dehalococcoidia bacterium]